MPAGRRSGKTERAKRFLVANLWTDFLHPKPWDDPRYFAAAPTRDQARTIWWEDLKKLVPVSWLEGAPRETDLTIKTKWGSELKVIGLDKPQRIEGVSWDGGVIDELADTKPETWSAHIRPALSDRNGWAWLIGVPDRDAPGQVEYKRMYEVARDGRDAEWDTFSWPSADILPAAEVESMRRSMDPELFDQECGGKFILAGGLAFPTFDYKTHVESEENLTVYDPSLPLCWSLDFNVTPMASGIIQHHKGHVRVLHEFALRDSDTNTACIAFIDWLETNDIKPTQLNIYGDPTGNARDSTSGTTDWTIVENRLKHLHPSICVARSPWPIKDTVNAVRARLKNAAGQVGLAIHSSCRVLIDDFGTALWPDDLEEQHALAWLRYFMIWEYPVNSEVEVQPSRFAVI